jgi:hypothetical protein
MSCVEVGENVWADDYGHVIVNVHKPNQCARDYCTIHRNSNHSMVGFPQRWRQDRHMMERICPHGIGHPDPDDIVLDRTHGCDGCCAPEDTGWLDIGEL